MPDETNVDFNDLTDEDILDCHEAPLPSALGPKCKLCFIDTETTGLFPWKHGIIQIAFIIVIDGVVKEKVDLMVNPFPQDAIEDGALKANGRDRDTLFNNLPPAEAFTKLESTLAKYVKKTDTSDKFFFCAYNAKFDEEFMRQWFKKNGSNYFGSWFFSPTIDVMVLAGLSLLEERPKMENFKLGTVLQHLGIKPTGNLHDGMVDIEATYQLFKKLTTN